MLEPAHRPSSARRTTVLAAWALTGATAVGCAGTFFVPGLLHGPAAMNGSARGTALVLLILGVPGLIVTLLVDTAGFSAPARRKAVLIRLGTMAYIVYNSVLLLFATPFNELFLFYLAMLNLSLVSLVSLLALLARIDAGAVDGEFRSQRAAHWIAAYLLAVAVLNALLWLRGVTTGLGQAAHPPFLAGTGLTTSPVYVQDLAIWLPLAAVTAFWLWQRRPLGVVLAGGYLSMWVLESVSVATDQWFGSRADPSSSVVSSSMVLPFLVLAGLSLLVLSRFLRQLGPAAVAARTP